MISSRTLSSVSRNSTAPGDAARILSRTVRPLTIAPRAAITTGSRVDRSPLTVASSCQRLENVASRTWTRMASYDRHSSSSPANWMRRSVSTRQATASALGVHQSFAAPLRARTSTGYVFAGITCHARRYSSSFVGAASMPHIMPVFAPRPRKGKAA